MGAWEDRRGGTERDGSGRAEEFEFVSTRYRSSGSICPRPSFCVSPSSSLSVALVISIRPLLSPSLYTAAASSSSLASFLTLGERILSTTLLSPPACLVLSRQPHRFTFYVPPAVSLTLSLSIYLSTFLWRTRAPRINPSPFRAPYLLSRTGSIVLPLAPGAPPRAFLSLFLPP